MVTDAAPLFNQPPMRRMQHRMFVRDVLQDAFTRNRISDGNKERRDNEIFVFSLTIDGDSDR